MIAAKHFDPVLGIDIHIIQPPGPVPPLPVPHPFVGMLIDPTEYVPVIGGTVKVNGMMRGVAGTGGKAIPPHVPIGGVFVVPPGNECEMFMGSATVQVDGDPQSRLGDPALSCHSVGMPSIPRLKIHAKPKTLMLPTSVVLAVPMGPPVLVGGPPTISLMGMAMKFGLAALGKVMKKLRKLQKASKKWKALSDKMHKAADKLLDKVPGGKKLKGKAHNAICSLTGHPVDVASGKVTTESTDVELPGPLPFTFSRVWYSQSTYAGPLGHGWHHSYDLGLYRFPEGIAVRLADGRFVVFDPPVPGEPAFDRTEKLFLHLTDRGYHVETLDGLAYHFGWPVRDEAEVPLDHVRDSNGNRILLERHAGKLVAFIDSGGRRLPVTTDSVGRITEIRVPDPDKPGHTFSMVSFRYDRHGDLIQADDALGHPFRYEYLDHLLVRETDRAGLAFYFMYDGSGPDAKCLRTWGDGNLFLRDLSYDDARRRTEVTNSLGHKTVYEWNAAGLVVKETDPLGGVTLTEWSPHNDKLSVTNPNGEKTAFEYDDQGRLLGVTDPAGAVVAYEYDAAGNQVKFTDPNGHAWAREYDDRRNVVAVIDPLGHRRTFKVNDRGLPIELRNEEGEQTNFTWDGRGLLASVAGVWWYEYDALGGCVRRRRDGAGTVAFLWGRDGRVSAYTDEAGRQTTCRRDPRGSVTAVTDPLGNIWRYTYGLPERLTEAVDPDGTTVRYVYSPDGELTEIRTAAGDVWAFRRDAAERVTEEVRWDGQRFGYRYDPAGRVVVVTDPLGRATELTRNPAGRVVKKRYADGSEETFGYTSGGRLARAANAGGVVEWRYDPLGRVLAERSSVGAVVNQYDRLGRLTARTTPTGRRLHLRYDATTGYECSLDGGALFECRLDPLGREIRRTYPGGVTLARGYDRGGDLEFVERTSADGRDRREYEYDPVGGLSGITDTAVGSLRLSHGRTGRLLSARSDDRQEDWPRATPGTRLGTPPPGSLTVGPFVTVVNGLELEYNRAGQLVRKEGGGRRQRFEYDAAGRLSRVIERDGTSTEFGYDAIDRRVWKRSAAGRSEYTWDGPLVAAERFSPPTGPAVVREYVYQLGSASPVAVLTDDRRLFLDCELNGLPQAATDRDGRTVFRTRLSGRGNLDPQSGDPSEVPFRFTGQWHDPETGLHYNHFRYYDPATAGYLTPDPVGALGGLHLWGYVSCPFAQVDPLGLARLCKADAQAEAQRIMNDAEAGNVRFSTGYHGDTKHNFTDARVQDILANPDRVYLGGGKNSELIFRQGEDIVVVRPSGSTKGVYTAYGPSGVLNAPTHMAPGTPVTDQMITGGTIPAGGGKTLPPATPIISTYPPR